MCSALRRPTDLHQQNQHIQFYKIFTRKGDHLVSYSKHTRIAGTVDIIKELLDASKISGFPWISSSPDQRPVTKKYYQFSFAKIKCKLTNFMTSQIYLGYQYLQMKQRIILNRKYRTRNIATKSMYKLHLSTRKTYEVCGPDELIQNDIDCNGYVE